MTHNLCSIAVVLNDRAGKLCCVSTRWETELKRSNPRRSVPVIDDCPKAAQAATTLSALIEQLPHRVVHLTAKRAFREPGTERNEVLLVRSGLMCTFESDSAGRRQIVALRFPGEPILPGEGMSRHGIQAIVWSEVLVASANDFATIVDTHPDAHNLLWRVAQRNESISYEWLMNCGCKHSLAKVAHLLCETVVRTGTDIRHEALENPFTQKHIAEITGQTSVNVNRVFADLESRGLIKRTGRDILFLDWTELRRLASFHPAYLE